MLHLWVLLGFQGPLLLPPVVPPGPVLGALLVGLAVYNAMQLIQPPWAPNNSREKPVQGTPETGVPTAWNYASGPGTIWVVRARAFSELICGGWCDWNGIQADTSDPVEGETPSTLLPGGTSTTVQIRKVTSSDNGPFGLSTSVFIRSFNENGDVTRGVVTTGAGTSHEIEIYPASLPPGQTDPGPGFPDLPAAFIPPPYFQPQADPERKPLAPPSPKPTPGPSRPATPDKAKPTQPNDPGIKEPEILDLTTRTPDGRPEPYEYEWFGLQPEPVQVGNPSRPADVTGGTVTTGGVTRAAEANTGQVNTPSRRAVPSYTPTTNDGQVQPQPAPSPNTTPAGQKTIAGTQVQPLRVPATIAGVAQELGRVESKLESLLRGADRNGNKLSILDNLDDLLDAVLFITDLLTNDVEAKEYEITAPCDKDELGNPLKFQRSFPAEDYGPATLRRTEAILDALATLARWKHRTCAPMGGQPVNNVTITAYEVMEP